MIVSRQSGKNQLPVHSSREPLIISKWMQAAYRLASIGDAFIHALPSVCEKFRLGFLLSLFADIERKILQKARDGFVWFLGDHRLTEMDRFHAGGIVEILD